MLEKKLISNLLHQLNDKLRSNGVKGELGIVGGAVMCLVFDARAATRDIDAIFKPSTLIRKLAQEIAEDYNVPDDWLNDAAKGYLATDFEKIDVMALSNLIVWAPEPKCMLAMKCLSARWDSSDKDDVEFLIRYLGIKDSKSVLQNLEHYYPKNIIPIKTQFFIEELMEQLNNG